MFAVHSAFAQVSNTRSAIDTHTLNPKHFPNPMLQVKPLNSPFCPQKQSPKYLEIPVFYFRTFDVIKYKR